ncbi:MAG: hypothetical protein JWN44_4247 [Myxococcales bacterium]|nr:hypothetical protein [Myxococcales bacterium]
MTTFRSRRFTELVVGLALLLAAAAAHAESAKTTYQRGLDLYATGNYDGAAAAFVQAHAMKPKPLILFNVAQAYRKGGHFAEALTYYKRFLAEAPESEKAPLEDETRKYVAEIEAHQALERSLIEKADREEAAKLDAKPAPPPPRIEAAAPGKLAPTTPPAQGATSPAVATLATEKPSDKPPVYKRWWLWTAVGAVVVVGVGVGLGVGLSSKPSAPDTALGTREPQF